MRKMMSVILTIMIIASLTACGTNPANSEAGATQSTTQSTKEAVETTAEPAVTETVDTENTEEPAEAVDAPITGPYDNLVDWVIGKDIWVYENKRLVSNLPELAIKLPSSDNLISVDEFPSENDYNIEIPTTDDFVVASALLEWADNTDLCFAEQLHKEFTTYGKYTFDWGYANNIANIAVGCPDTDTSILITLSIYKKDETDNRKPTSDEAKAEFEKFVNTNVEYVREQVQSWDQNYIPSGEMSKLNNPPVDENTADLNANDEVVYSQETTEQWIEDYNNSFYRQYKQADGVCSFTIVRGENGNDTLTANDGTNSYEFTMKVLGEGTYGVYSNDIEVFEIYEEDAGKEVYVIDGTYSAFAGIYE